MPLILIEGGFRGTKPLKEQSRGFLRAPHLIVNRS
jgi:hypothetical protein